MDKYQRQEYAVKRKIERERIIDSAFAEAPKRKPKGSEIASIVLTIETLHELLYIFDGSEEPPAFAGVAETAFDAAIERLRELIEAATK